MIEITLYAFLIGYSVLVLIFFIFALVNLLHLLFYGFLNFQSFLVTFLFISGIVLILFITYQLGVEINWSQSITL